MPDQRTFFGAPESALLSAPRLAEILKVSDQMIYNWRDMGLKFIVRDGVQMYALDDAKAFQAAHSSELGRGGKRGGAGRKPHVRKATEAAREMHTAAILGTGSGGIELQPDSGKPVSIESVQDLMSQGDKAGLTPSQARSLKETYGAAALKMEIEKELGSLVLAEDVEDAWTTHMKVVRTRIEGIPLKAAQALRRVIKMDPELFDKVRGALQGLIDGELKALSDSGDPADAGEEETEEGVAA